MSREWVWCSWWPQLTAGRITDIDSLSTWFCLPSCRVYCTVLWVAAPSSIREAFRRRPVGMTAGDKWSDFVISITCRDIFGLPFALQASGSHTISRSALSGTVISLMSCCSRVSGGRTLWDRRHTRAVSTWEGHTRAVSTWRGHLGLPEISSPATRVFVAKRAMSPVMTTISWTNKWCDFRVIGPIYYGIMTAN